MYNNEKIKNLILNTISMTVSNPDFSENNFTSIIENFNKELPDLIKQYEAHCKKENKNPEYLKSPIKLNKKQNIVKSIQMGEKEFLKRTQSIPLKIRNLYALLLVLAKSLCTNILDLTTFGIAEEEGYETILTLLNSFNVLTITSSSTFNLLATIIAAIIFS